MAKQETSVRAFDRGGVIISEIIMADEIAQYRWREGNGQRVQLRTSRAIDGGGSVGTEHEGENSTERRFPDTHVLIAYERDVGGNGIV